ncbi:MULTISPECIES: hypothetical protein [Burkholderia]|uniref:Uncharacterized protein n=1 Tax=Burkholderia cenocepacia TaxID=95486 RepID=A0A071MK54_9BURK|nr:hypothetical protein [Burkholderia seminalis]AOJ29325.1 hypothetical protein WJ12_31565 [Burkholderia seminalis]KVF52215.1 hypothetical protein WJ13_09645 [Burkholderia seminalis]MBJ9592623.1 hypothetical protein [Burkholderia seminalis]MCA8041196.1 hypothetical protein [Burkholderia seminalis]QTO21063.1 hypothetical protein DT99_027400 [Burkholderia seminalis]
MIVRSTLSRGLSSIISKFDGIGHIVTTIHWSDGSTIICRRQSHACSMTRSSRAALGTFDIRELYVRGGALSNG